MCSSDLIVENPNLDAMLGYRFLSHKFLSLVYPVASSPDCRLLVNDALDCLGKHLEKKMNASSNILNDSHNVEDVRQEEDLLSAARLKKRRFNQEVKNGKEVGSTNSASSVKRSQRNLMYVPLKSFNSFILIHYTKVKITS